MGSGCVRVIPKRSARRGSVGSRSGCSASLASALPLSPRSLRSCNADRLGPSLAVQFAASAKHLTLLSLFQPPPTPTPGRASRARRVGAVAREPRRRTVAVARATDRRRCNGTRKVHVVQMVGRMVLIL